MPRKLGRPKKAGQPGERVSLGLRVTADLKTRLDAAADDSGRSQSQEAELRLERSFNEDRTAEEISALTRTEIQDQFGGERHYRIMRYLGAMIVVIEDARGASWEKDADTNELVIEQIREFFRRYGPGGPRIGQTVGVFEKAAQDTGAAERFDALRAVLAGKVPKQREKKDRAKED